MWYTTACHEIPQRSGAAVPTVIVTTLFQATRCVTRRACLARQDPCLSLAFDYAEHDLYAMIAYHRERLRSAPISAYTLKSVMWQLLNGLSYLEQVQAGAVRSCDISVL
jgi:hypothetical protein